MIAVVRKYTPKSRKQWRQWLSKNHADVEEVWLVFYKKHTGKPTLSYNDAVEEALCFGWIDGIRKRIDEERYMHRFTPRRPKSSWSPSNRKRVARLLEQGLMTAAGMAHIEQAKRKGTWELPEEQPPPVSMPAELDRALRRDKKASAHFDTLAPSYRRQYMAWIGAAKRPQTRAKRVAETIAALRDSKKPGMA